jgi:hypothetical protein
MALAATQQLLSGFQLSHCLQHEDQDAELGVEQD